MKGRVLEIGEAAYTRRFGGSRVIQSDVLHPVAGNDEATLVGNLTTGEGIPQSAFDCISNTSPLYGAPFGVLLHPPLPLANSQKKIIASVRLFTQPGPEGEVNGCPLAHQLSGVKLTNHEEDANQPFLRINEVARTIGA